MLIICDFDGTVTTSDTNSALAQRFAPEAYAGLEGKLAAREMTLREVLEAEFGGVRDGLAAVLHEACQVPLRDGFGELLERAERSGHSVVLLSSGFREIIEPILEHNGFAGRVPLLANSIVLDARGGTITWRDLPTCSLCGEQCKRHDVADLRERYAPEGDVVVFVGDGLSDRCGAETADRVFARDALARYLDERSLPYEPWDDFDDVVHRLGLGSAEVLA